MGKKKTQNSTDELYSVVKFVEGQMKLFECIPDLWYVDDERATCYWPPKTGMSFRQRAMKREKPDDTWTIEQCTPVSEGFATCSQGFTFVREKCAQNYNTSSADEHLDASQFRRNHPVLSLQANKKFENLFAEKKKEAKKATNPQKNYHKRDGNNMKTAQRGKSSKSNATATKQKKQGRNPSIAKSRSTSRRTSFDRSRSDRSRSKRSRSSSKRSRSSSKRCRSSSKRCRSSTG